MLQTRFPTLVTFIYIPFLENFSVKKDDDLIQYEMTLENDNKTFDIEKSVKPRL